MRLLTLLFAGRKVMKDVVSIVKVVRSVRSRHVA